MIEMSELNSSSPEPGAEKAEIPGAPAKTLPSLAALFCVVGFPIHIRRQERVFDHFYADYYYDEEEELDEAKLLELRTPKIVIHEQLGILVGVTLNASYEEEKQGSVLYSLSLQDGSTVPVAQGDSLTVRGFIGTSSTPRNALLNPQSTNSNLKLHPSK